jgi:hypothetical protein
MEQTDKPILMCKETGFTGLPRAKKMIKENPLALRDDLFCCFHFAKKKNCPVNP